LKKSKWTRLDQKSKVNFDKEFNPEKSNTKNNKEDNKEKKKEGLGNSRHTAIPGSSYIYRKMNKKLEKLREKEVIEKVGKSSVGEEIQITDLDQIPRLKSTQSGF